MATINNHFNMYDPTLKPKLLQRVIKEQLPDESHSSSAYPNLSSIVSMLKSHELLSEFVSDTVDLKVVENWKSVVDDWINRLLLLVSCKNPDKCWAGISLLGVTCQECSSIRFMESCSLWFLKLLSHLQDPTDSHFLKIASLGAIADLITRLGSFPNVKKAEVLDVGKLIQSSIKLLNEDATEAVAEGVAYLFTTILTYFPSSVRGAYDIVEAAVVSNLLAEKCDIRLRKKFASCLALLPRTVGDAGSWSAMMERTLLSINSHLEHAFEGLEHENKSNEVFRQLVPPGKEPPPPLGGREITGMDLVVKMPEQFLAHVISSLMICCSDLLTNGYPVQVSIPVRPLLSTMRRVLMVDGSVSQSISHYATAMQPELVCSLLHELHIYSLELLVAIIKGLDSQLLPYAAEILRLLKRYFSSCLLSQLRVKVYYVMKILLISMGAGISMHLAGVVVDNAILDLGRSSATNPNPCTKASFYWSRKKRKRRVPSVEDQCLGVREMAKDRTSVPLKIAALEAVESLLTVGRGLLRPRSSPWRGKMDLVLMDFADSVCRWSTEGTPVDPDPLFSQLQLASLSSLLATLLAPSLTRPVHLPRALRLFRTGKLEGGQAMADFCAQALLSVEVLIRPRALPLSFPPPPPTNFSDAGDGDEEDELLRVWRGPLPDTTAGEVGVEPAEAMAEEGKEGKGEASMELQQVVQSAVSEEEDAEVAADVVVQAVVPEEDDTGPGDDVAADVAYRGGEGMELHAVKEMIPARDDVVGTGQWQEVFPVWETSPDDEPMDPCPDIVVGEGPDSDSL